MTYKEMDSKIIQNLNMILNIVSSLIRVGQNLPEISIVAETSTNQILMIGSSQEAKRLLADRARNKSSEELTNLINELSNITFDKKDFIHYTRNLNSDDLNNLDKEQLEFFEINSARFSYRISNAIEINALELISSMVGLVCKSILLQQIRNPDENQLQRQNILASLDNICEKQNLDWYSNLVNYDNLAKAQVYCKFLLKNQYNQEFTDYINNNLSRQNLKILDEAFHIMERPIHETFSDFLNMHSRSIGSSFIGAHSAGMGGHSGSEERNRENIVKRLIKTNIFGNQSDIDANYESIRVEIEELKGFVNSKITFDIRECNNIASKYYVNRYSVAKRLLDGINYDNLDPTFNNPDKLTKSLIQGCIALFWKKFKFLDESQKEDVFDSLLLTLHECQRAYNLERFYIYFLSNDQEIFSITDQVGNHLNLFNIILKVEEFRNNNSFYESLSLLERLKLSNIASLGSTITNNNLDDVKFFFTICEQYNKFLFEDFAPITYKDLFTTPLGEITIDHSSCDPGTFNRLFDLCTTLGNFNDVSYLTNRDLVLCIRDSYNSILNNEDTLKRIVIQEVNSFRLTLKHINNAINDESTAIDLLNDLIIKHLIFGRIEHNHGTAFSNILTSLQKPNLPLNVIRETFISTGKSCLEYLDDGRPQELLRTALSTFMAGIENNRTRIVNDLFENNYRLSNVNIFNGAYAHELSLPNGIPFISSYHPELETKVLVSLKSESFKLTGNLRDINVNNMPFNIAVCIQNNPWRESSFLEGTDNPILLRPHPFSMQDAASSSDMTTNCQYDVQQVIRNFSALRILSNSSISIHNNTMSPMDMRVGGFVKKGKSSSFYSLVKSNNKLCLTLHVIADDSLANRITHVLKNHPEIQDLNSLVMLSGMSWNTYSNEEYKILLDIMNVINLTNGILKVFHYELLNPAPFHSRMLFQMPTEIPPSIRSTTNQIPRSQGRTFLTEPPVQRAALMPLFNNSPTTQIPTTRTEQQHQQEIARQGQSIIDEMSRLSSLI